MTTRHRNASWWVKCIIHNMMIHPLLPLADVFEHGRLNAFSQLIYKLHDRSAPAGGG